MVVSGESPDEDQAKGGRSPRRRRRRLAARKERPRPETGSGADSGGRRGKESSGGKKKMECGHIGPIWAERNPRALFSGKLAQSFCSAFFCVCVPHKSQLHFFNTSFAV
jgi:hypothetical protein